MAYWWVVGCRYRVPHAFLLVVFILPIRAVGGGGDPFVPVRIFNIAHVLHTLPIARRRHAARANAA